MCMSCVDVCFKFVVRVGSPSLAMRWSVEQISSQTVDQEKLLFSVAYDGSTPSKAALDLGVEYFLSKRKNATGRVIYVTCLVFTAHGGQQALYALFFFAKVRKRY